MSECDELKSVMRFRKKPVEIEAKQWHRHGDFPGVYQFNALPGFCCAVCGEGREAHGFIDTLEDGHRVCPGDWIITGVKGEIYPCKPDIFAATYEPAQQASQQGGECQHNYSCACPAHCCVRCGEPFPAPAVESGLVVALNFAEEVWNECEYGNPPADWAKDRLTPVVEYLRALTRAPADTVTDEMVETAAKEFIKADIDIRSINAPYNTVYLRAMRAALTAALQRNKP